MEFVLADQIVAAAAAMYAKTTAVRGVLRGVVSDAASTRRGRRGPRSSSAGAPIDPGCSRVTASGAATTVDVTRRTRVLPRAQEP